MLRFQEEKYVGRLIWVMYLGCSFYLIYWKYFSLVWVGSSQTECETQQQYHTRVVEILTGITPFLIDVQKQKIFSLLVFEFMPDVCRYNLYFRLVAAVESSNVRQNNDWISM